MRGGDAPKPPLRRRVSARYTAGRRPARAPPGPVPNTSAAPTRGEGPGSGSVRHPPVGPGVLLEFSRALGPDLVTPVARGVGGLQRPRECGSCCPTRSRRYDPAAPAPRGAGWPCLCGAPAADPVREASCPDVGLASGSCSRRGRARGRCSGASRERAPGPPQGSLTHAVQDSFARKRPCGLRNVRRPAGAGALGRAGHGACGCPRGPPRRGPRRSRD